uniref:Uncharacterized protein n=1 Tax=Spironucleus salmonicida TaxID=348837 RepID=V6LU12_9EUKA|eukprot:EST44279.1 Hypothetical protein SS50377_15880 [Spironucleus salmonicida]
MAVVIIVRHYKYELDDVVWRANWDIPRNSKQAEIVPPIEYIGQPMLAPASEIDGRYAALSNTIATTRVDTIVIAKDASANLIILGQKRINTYYVISKMQIKKMLVQLIAA